MKVLDLLRAQLQNTVMLFQRWEYDGEQMCINYRKQYEVRQEKTLFLLCLPQRNILNFKC